MPRNDRAIMSLTIPTLTGGKDDYGREEAPPNPLSIDRVMEGKQLASQSRLLALPVEILGSIMQHLSSRDMQVLAFVNSDCRQLARSHQFKSVLLDYKPRCTSMLLKLLDEGVSRLRYLAEGRAPGENSLGSCIRRLTVSTDPAWILRPNGIAAQEFDELDDAAQDELLSTASKAYYDSYLKMIEAVLRSRAMPNLELLNWEDKAVLPKSLFQAIAKSRIQHLRLFRVQVDEDFEAEIPQNHCWPLRTLHLEVRWNLFEKKRSTSPLILSILRSCAPTLESLKLASPVGCTPSSIDNISFPHSWKGVNFPRLRRLALSLKSCGDPNVLDTFLGPETAVRELNLGRGNMEIAQEFFGKRGQIRSLETLVCNLENFNNLLSFNPQLSKLMMLKALPATLVDNQVLPVLSRSFRSLSSLSLTWGEPFISAQALEQINTLDTLQQLQLSAGNQCGWEYDWVIEHEEIRSRLSNLSQLRRLSFRRDTYSPFGDGNDKVEAREFDYNHYYSMRVWSPSNEREQAVAKGAVGPENAQESELEAQRETEIPLVIRRHKAAFEVVHRMRMQAKADRYACVFPLLKWIYLGQLPFAIQKGGSREMVALSNERDECYTYLCRLFGFPNCGEG